MKNKIKNLFSKVFEEQNEEESISGYMDIITTGTGVGALARNIEEIISAIKAKLQK